MSNVDISRYSKRLVQLFWDPAPKNDSTSHVPVWCLGRKYEPQRTITPENKPLDHETRSPSHPPATASPDQQDVADDTRRPASSEGSFDNVRPDEIPPIPPATADDWPEAFLDDFEARLWFTYRSNFPLIPKSDDPKAVSSMSLSVRLKAQLSSQSGFTSDTGWGCMIRSGQSLLANALLFLRLGRDWTRSTTPDHREREIISYFADDPNAPFSIHRFVERGASVCGTFPGQWFGPSATAKCIEILTNEFRESDLRVYITGDGPDVFEDALFRLAKGDGDVFRPTLLLVGTRLGIHRVTPAYWSALKTCLQLPQSVGIAGGRPSSSHYFIGCQGSDFFYLDPHQTQPALPYHSNVDAYSVEDINSCHTRRLRRINVEEMDPSMLIAFLFRDEADWHAWRHSISTPPSQGADATSPSGKNIVHVVDSETTRYGHGTERDGAVDEVETLDTDIDDGVEVEAEDDTSAVESNENPQHETDGELVQRPSI